MHAVYSKNFLKQLERAPQPIQKAFRLRMELLIENPRHPLLRNHELQGVLLGYRSINVTGDWRAVFRILPREDAIFFVAIGTHSQLYR